MSHTICRAILWCFMSFQMVNLCHGRARSGVVIMGTTPSPNLTIHRGIVRKLCPEDFPYAYNKGKHCCRLPFQHDDPSKDLDIYDPQNKCPTAQQKPCVGKDTLCKTLATKEERTECPESHKTPLAKGAFCCKVYIRATNGQEHITATDEKEECAENKRIACPSLPEKRCALTADLSILCPHPYLYAYSNGCCKSNMRTNLGPSSPCNGLQLQPSDPDECCEDPKPISSCTMKERICTNLDPCVLNWIFDKDASTPNYGGSSREADFSLDFLMIDDANCDVYGTHYITGNGINNAEIFMRPDCPGVAHGPAMIKQMFIKNSRNAPFKDRGAKTVEIYTKESEASSYQLADSHVFPDPRPLACTHDDYKATLHINKPAKWVKILLVDYYGKSTGLQYVELTLET